MNYILSVAMSVQVELKEDFNSYLKSKLEYYISLLFHYLHMPPNQVNFELKETDKISFQYQNVLAGKGLFIPDNFTYEFLLMKVRPYRILELVVAILHERPIFIVDDNIDEMAIIMKSLISFIKPMTWVNPIVPMIPADLAAIIGSPMGTLVGIHTKIWEEEWEQNEDLLSKDAYVLFLNEDSNIWVNKLWDIPKAKVLEDFLYIFRDYLKDPDDAKWVLRAQWDKMLAKIGIGRKPTHEDYMVYTQLKIDFEFFYKIFLRFFRDIPKFLDYSVDPKDYMERKEGIQIFDSDKFIEGVDEIGIEFIKGCLKTQLFANFIDKAFKIHHNLLEENEEDYEKIEYFFRCLEVCQEKSPKDLRKYMNIQFKRALKSYYQHKNKWNLDDFTQIYVEKFESYFQEKITPTNYLIQQTVINSERQLTLIENINHRLIMKHLARPFEDTPQNQPSQQLNFSDFEQFKSYDWNRLSHSKTSHQTELIVEEQEEIVENVKWKVKKMSAEDKRAAFKNK